MLSTLNTPSIELNEMVAFLIWKHLMAQDQLSARAEFGLSHECGKIELKQKTPGINPEGQRNHITGTTTKTKV